MPTAEKQVKNWYDRLDKKVLVDILKTVEAFADKCADHKPTNDSMGVWGYSLGMSQTGKIIKTKIQNYDAYLK